MTFVAGELIVAVAAIDEVVARATGEAVVTLGADNSIVSVTAGMVLPDGAEVLVKRAVRGQLDLRYRLGCRELHLQPGRSSTAACRRGGRLAHLAVSVRDGTVVVGPLVRPGASPCLNCLDLHRSDRDPDWGAIAAQLHTSPELPEAVTAATVLAGAAFAAEEVLTHIDGGRPSTLGATVEISAPGRSTRRQWSQHPACGCRRRGRSRSLEPPAPHS